MGSTQRLWIAMWTGGIPERATIGTAHLSNGVQPHLKMHRIVWLRAA